jgi:hypothetical protein
MPKPFDAATKHLIESQPGDWMEYVGLARANVDVVDADLSTVTAWVCATRPRSRPSCFKE